MPGVTRFDEIALKIQDHGYINGIALWTYLKYSIMWKKKVMYNEFAEDLGQPANIDSNEIE